MDKAKKKRYRKMIRKRAGPKPQGSVQAQSGRQGSVKRNGNAYTHEGAHESGTGVNRSSVNA